MYIVMFKRLSDNRVIWLFKTDKYPTGQQMTNKMIILGENPLEMYWTIDNLESITDL